MLPRAYTGERAYIHVNPNHYLERDFEWVGMGSSRQLIFASSLYGNSTHFSNALESHHSTVTMRVALPYYTQALGVTQT